MDAGVPPDENPRERVVTSKDASPETSRREDGGLPSLHLPIILPPMPNPADEEAMKRWRWHCYCLRTFFGSGN